MRELKAIETAENKAKEIMDSITGLKELYAGYVQKAEEKVSEASTAKDQATRNQDVRAYRKAKKDLSDALDEKEIYLKSLTALEEQELISADEYGELIDNIFAEVAEVETEKRKSIDAHAIAMQKEAEEPRR